jgi:hypothetical protein
METIGTYIRKNSIIEADNTQKQSEGVGRKKLNRGERKKRRM